MTRPLKRKLFFFELGILICMGGCYRSQRDMMVRMNHTKTYAPLRYTSRPYCIRGFWYFPQPYYNYNKIGLASYYGLNDGFHGQKTANGEVFHKDKFTAAHRTLPLPCLARITNLENNKQIIVKINDRGPYYHDRIIDVSHGVAKKLGMVHHGQALVNVEVLIQGSKNLHENKHEFIKR